MLGTLLVGRRWPSLRAELPAVLLLFSTEDDGIAD
jgi:hypothetical protein